MEYGKIVTMVSSIFDTRKNMFYKPADKRLKDMYWLGKGIDMTEATQYKFQTVINHVEILIVKNAKSKEVYDVVYLPGNGDITFVIFADNLLEDLDSNGGIENLFKMVDDIILNLVNIICRRLGVEKTTDSLYSVMTIVADTVMTIKAMQNIVVDFNQDDIPGIFEIYKDSAVEFKELIDLCFVNDTEVLLEQGLVYEVVLKLLKVG